MERAPRARLPDAPLHRGAEAGALRPRERPGGEGEPRGPQAPPRCGRWSSRPERRRTALRAPEPVDAETAKKLQALGYLTGTARDDGGARPDPKDAIGSLVKLQSAAELHQAGRSAEAVPLLLEVLAANPRLVDGWEILASALEKLGRLDEALAGAEEDGRPLAAGTIELRRRRCGARAEGGPPRRGPPPRGARARPRRPPGVRRPREGRDPGREARRGSRGRRRGAREDGLARGRGPPRPQGGGPRAGGEARRGGRGVPARARGVPPEHRGALGSRDRRGLARRPDRSRAPRRGDGEDGPDRGGLPGRLRQPPELRAGRPKRGGSSRRGDAPSRSTRASRARRAPAGSAREPADGRARQRVSPPLRRPASIPDLPIA